MSAILLGLLILLAAAVILRRCALALVGPDARPQDLLQADSGQNEHTLISHRHQLVGRPDFIFEEHGELVPVERKSRHLTKVGCYNGEKLQLAAYAVLLEETAGRPVRRGRLEYPNGTIDVRFDRSLRSALLRTLRELHQFQQSPNVRRQHNLAARCRSCGFRNRCSDSLAG